MIPGARAAQITLKKLAGDSGLPLDLLGASILVGVAGGYAGVLYHHLTDFIQRTVLRIEGDPLEVLRSVPWWWQIWVPALGGLLIAPIVYRLVTEARGTGTPEVMKAVIAEGGKIRGRVAIAKLFASAVTVGTGGSVGREGPIIQIGAALGSKAGQLMKWSTENTTSLVGAGAAAGIAAMFNAPIAGAFFALEVILRNFAASLFAPIVLASVTATAVSRAHMGDYPAFRVPTYNLESGYEVGVYVFMGLVCALVGVAFMRFLQTMNESFAKLPIHDFLKPAVGGLGVGLLLVVTPAVYGTGFSAISDILTHEQTIWTLAVWLVAKALATSLTVASGGSGGIFSPSLFLGAIIGWMFGFVAHSIFPDATGTPGAYALVGMGAMLAAVTHAPITSILMLFEITGNYQIILPLMAASVTATLISRRFNEMSIYDQRLIALGIDPKVQAEARLMETFKVEDVMRAGGRTVQPAMPVPKLVTEFLASRVNERYVVDEDGRYHGVITLHDINEVNQLGETPENLIVAEDVARTDVPSVLPESSLSNCMELMLRHHATVLPVVSDSTAHFLGTVSEHDIIGLYNREIIRKDILGTLDYEDEEDPDRHNLIHLPHGFCVERLAIPLHHAGKSLKELNLRANFNLTVVSIQDPNTPDRDEVPNPEKPLP
ncbi:MAG: chloride channel protein, partial [Myxococcota bacterium]